MISWVVCSFVNWCFVLSTTYSKEWGTAIDSIQEAAVHWPGISVDTCSAMASDEPVPKRQRTSFEGENIIEHSFLTRLKNVCLCNDQC